MDKTTNTLAQLALLPFALAGLLLLGTCAVCVGVAVTPTLDEAEQRTAQGAWWAEE